MAPRQIRIYKYYFSGDLPPIEIEAQGRVQARAKLNEVVHSQRKFYEGHRLEGETVTKPLVGVTKKVENGIEFVWVGFTISPIDGWQETFLYNLHQKKMRNATQTVRIKSKK